MARSPEKRVSPEEVLNGARSLISVLMNYFPLEESNGSPRRGFISRYAWGRDYHLIVKEKLRRLEEELSSLFPGQSSLAYVDTGPVLDKWWAENAGLGWIGKNGNLITRELGSWVFVGEVLTTHEFDASDYDPPFRHPREKFAPPIHFERSGSMPSPESSAAASNTPRNFCGSCDRCLRVCPTQAIVAPYVVDARRCISYLTIELRGAIPRELRPLIGNRIFGCDDCQDVCPWNRFAVPSDEPDFRPASGNLHPRLRELLGISREEFERRFKESPIKRAKYAGFLRNVAVAMGNSHAAELAPALIGALSHPEPMARQHAAWALAEIGTDEALSALRKFRRTENHPEVLEEIDHGLNRRRDSIN